MRCRVLINGCFLAQAITGVQRYGREMVDALFQKSDPRFEFIVALPRRIASLPVEGRPMVVGGSVFPSPIWQQLWLPSVFRRLGCDLLWSPCNLGPARLERHVVTIHDASPFACGEWFSPPFLWYYRWAWRELGRHAVRVVTTSDFSRRELVARGVTTADKIRVVPGGVSPRFHAPEVESRKRGYVLTVGSRDPRKNVRRLVEAWGLIPEGIRRGRELLVAGGASVCFAPEGIGVPGSADVRFVGYVADGDLPALYAGADAFVFPSLYEGFGLPPLEAMACGCPVVASRAAPMPEVCGRAAVYVDPLDAGSIADGIGRVLGDAELSATLVEEGYRQAARFTWATSAEQLLDVFEECRPLRSGVSAVAG